eukprot:scaffold15614_cov94-Skeletonema_dohrnii-CCMP3373.AAC.1
MRRGRFDVTVLLSQTPDDSLTKQTVLSVQIACPSSASCVRCLPVELMCFMLQQHSDLTQLMAHY